MYLKKIDRPRAVTLPDGTIFSQADLPPADTVRWVASRKMAVVRGVAHGLISQADALKRYGLSSAEFREWLLAASGHGEEALKATVRKKI